VATVEPAAGMYIGQANDGAFDVVESLGVIDPNENMQPVV